MRAPCGLDECITLLTKQKSVAHLVYFICEAIVHLAKMHTKQVVIQLKHHDQIYISYHLQQQQQRRDYKGFHSFH